MSRSKKEQYKKMYMNTYNAHINKIISENEYINVLQILNMKGFKTYHIDNFDVLTKHLHTIGLYDSFNINTLVNIRDLIYNKLATIALAFIDIGEIFSVKKQKMISRINDIQKLLKHKMKCIHAFKNVDNVTSNLSNEYLDEILGIALSYELLPDQNKLDTNGSIENNAINKIRSKYKDSDWAFYVRKDITERLHLLVQVHYTLEQLKFMNIKLKLVSEIDMMSHSHLRKYYMYVIDTIETALKHWMTMCKDYIDIEINYVECCDDMINGHPTRLNVFDSIWLDDRVGQYCKTSKN